MNKIISTALITNAIENYRAFSAWGTSRHSSVPGVSEFATLFNAKLDKLASKGKLGPKGQAKLQAACPAQARQYFRGLESGFDLSTPEGVSTFVEVGQRLAGVAGKVVSQSETALVNAMVASIADSGEGDSDEDE